MKSMSQQRNQNFLAKFQVKLKFASAGSLMR